MAGVLDKFLAAQAPTYFSKRLRLLIFIPSCFGSYIDSFNWSGSWLLVKCGKEEEKNPNKLPSM